MGLLQIILLMLANAVITNALAFVVTQTEAIKVKPFNCYGCLSFWFTSIIGALLAYYVKPTYDHNPEAQALVFYGIIGASIMQGLINFFYYNSKFKIYE